MSFEEEWARSKESAGAAGPGAGYRPGLVAHQDDLGKVGSDAHALYRALKSGADIGGMGTGKDGKSSSERAAAELRRGNLDMGSELGTALRIWNSQVNTLLQASARISDHLDFTKKAHAQDEADVLDSMRKTEASGERAGQPLPTSKIYAYLGGD